MSRIESACNREFLRKPVDGYRDPHKVRWVVMHSTEGGTALGVAEQFKTHDGGYTHLVVDDKDCYRCLLNAAIPRGAPGANIFGFHIEQCGYARWSLVIWKKHRLTLERAAFKAALHCHVFNISPVFRTASELKRGLSGITTHAEVTKAFGPKGGHWDPGLFWPRKLFMQKVHGFYAGPV